MVRGRSGVVLAGLVACGPVDGTIFTEVTRGSTGDRPTGTGETSAGTGGSSTGTDAGSADAESSEGSDSGACIDDDPLVLEGNDPRFVHDCGESCDSDWCGCEPCRAVAGPLGRLPAGPHRLSINAGASGRIDYQLTLRLASGEVLAERSFDYDGLFTDQTQFEVPASCPVVEVEWVQQTELCSRVYELIVEPL